MPRMQPRHRPHWDHTGATTAALEAAMAAPAQLPLCLGPQSPSAQLPLQPMAPRPQPAIAADPTALHPLQVQPENEICL